MIKINASTGIAAENWPMSRSRLVREVGVVFVAKLALVIAAGVFVFGPDHRPRIDAGGVESHLIGQSMPISPSRNSTP
jgi:hypothetical protein